MIDLLVENVTFFGLIFERFQYLLRMSSAISKTNVGWKIFKDRRVQNIVLNSGNSEYKHIYLQYLSHLSSENIRAVIIDVATHQPELVNTFLPDISEIYLRNREFNNQDIELSLDVLKASWNIKTDKDKDGFFVFIDRIKAIDAVYLKKLLQFILPTEIAIDYSVSENREKLLGDIIWQLDDVGWPYTKYWLERFRHDGTFLLSNTFFYNKSKKEKITVTVGGLLIKYNLLGIESKYEYEYPDLDSASIQEIDTLRIIKTAKK